MSTRELHGMIEALGDRGVAMAVRYLETHGNPSDRILRSISFVVDRVDEADAWGRITVPIFWAIYVHDGRGAIDAREGKYLCYFPNRELDPRLRDAGPLGQIRTKPRKLTRGEFQYWLTVNRENYEQGLGPAMVVTKHVGPAKGTPFFSIGLKPLLREASVILPERFRLVLRRRGLLVEKEATLTAKIG